MKKLMKKVGRRIRELRQAQELTVEALAKKSGRSPAYIRRLEAGEVTNITVGQLQRIVRVLGATAEFALED